MPLRPPLGLLITGTWPPMHCGVGDYSEQLALALVRHGLHLKVLTSSPARAQRDPELTVLPEVEVWDRRTLGEVRRTVQALNPNFILFQWPTAGYGRSWAVNWLPAMLAREFPRIPLITTLHELRYFKPWTRLRALPAVFHSQRVVLVDPDDRPAAERLAPGSRARLKFIPIGSNLPAALPSTRAATRRKLGFKPKDLVVAYFGFINPPKGFPLLLEALGRLVPRYPQIKFLCMAQWEGKDPYHQQMRAKWQRLGLAPITQQPAFAEPEAAARILASADCAVLPFVEGVSLKRGSLMACLQQGLPVVTTRPQAHSAEWFHQGKDLLWVEPGDVTGLARAIEQLVQDRGLRATLARGAARLARRFSWDAIARQYLTLLRELGV